MSPARESFSEIKDKLCEAASAMCNGLATAEQIDWLETQLFENEEAKAFYLIYMRVHAELLWRWQGHDVQLPPADDSGPAEELTGESEKKAHIPVLGFMGEMMQAMGGFTSFLPKVALVVIFLLGLWLLIAVGLKNGSHTSLMADDGRHLGVACLTAAADCVWNEGARKPELGDNLGPRETLKLDEGTVEISMEGGTRLILQGPATFRIVSEASGFLLSGKLTVIVPRGVSSFYLETPRFAVSKSDVEYGVVVGRDGGGSLEVFRGSVALQSDTPSGQVFLRQVAAGSAVRVNPNGRIDDMDPASGVTRFVRQMPAPTQPQMIRGLRMWLKADAGVFQDSKRTIPAAPGGPVGCWIDQSGNGLSPRQDNPACRPHLAVDDLHNTVLRFDGLQEYLHNPVDAKPVELVLDPSDTGTKPQFAAFFVFRVPVSTPESQKDKIVYRDRYCLFGQFTDNTTDASRYFYTAEDGHFCYDEWPPKFCWLRSPFGTGVLGGIRIASITRDGRQRAMYINGILLAGDNLAENYAGMEPSCWWIGGRPILGKTRAFLLGDIAEILIYNRALSRRECLSVERYLREKYFGP